MHPRKGFTLIELLVVIAILAVLAVVVALTLNPAGLLQESRDVNRLADMATLNSAVSYSLTDNASESLGSSNVVYVSIPDPTATSSLGDQCQGLGLISLPAGYAYHCANATYYRQTNSTGWIPVNLANNTFGSSLAQLPIDPVNQSSSRLYYTYETNGSQFEVTSVFESSKYKLGGSNDEIAGDGGTLATVYEKGSKIGLEPLDYGDASLVGYWTFNEGTGSTTYDYSGNNATGSWNGTQAGTSGYYASGKIGPWAGTFNGSNDYVTVPITTALKPVAVSIAMWVDEPATWSGFETIGDTNQTGYTMVLDSGYLDWDIYNGLSTRYAITDFPVPSGWFFLVGTFTGSSMHFYANGQEVSGSPVAATLSYTSPQIYIGYPYSTVTTNYIDDLRIYNRALSLAEIQAMYNGGK